MEVGGQWGVSESLITPATSFCRHRPRAQMSVQVLAIDNADGNRRKVNSMCSDISAAPGAT